MFHEQIFTAAIRKIVGFTLYEALSSSSEDRPAGSPPGVATASVSAGWLSTSLLQECRLFRSPAKSMLILRIILLIFDGKIIGFVYLKL